ncbi:hypothetical protein ACFX15_027882 [Malus domestica]
MEDSVAGKSLIRVAAVCGSLRKASYNRGLIRYAIELSKTSISGLEIDYVDISELPFLNTDLQGEKEKSFPPAVEALRQKILEADSIVFCFSRVQLLHLRWNVLTLTMSGPLKNAIDWASRPPNVWADKAAAVVNASGDFGGGRAQYHLRQVGVSLDLHFINKPEFFLKGLQHNPPKFDRDGNLIDEQAKENLKEVLLSLQAFTLRLQKK